MQNNSEIKSNNLEGKDFKNDADPVFPTKLYTGYLPPHIKVSPDKKQIYCKNGARVGTLRSEEKLPINRYFYYFEITIKNAGKEISMGYLGKTFEAAKRVGDQKSSYGFMSLGTGQCNGGEITMTESCSSKAGDTIGCGIIFNHGEIFFTKNGVVCDASFDDAWDVAYPGISVCGEGEELSVNFGPSGFKCDIISVINKQKADFLSSVFITPTFDICDDLISSFVMHYLVYHGYSQTYNHLAKKKSKFSLIKTIKETDEFGLLLKSIKKRKIVIDKIKNGSAENALEVIKSSFGVLNDETEFCLRCQICLEILRKDGLECASGYALVNLKPFTDEKYGHQYKLPLKRIMCHLALSFNRDLLLKSECFCKKNYMGLADIVNNAIIEKMGSVTNEPLALLFKQAIAVDALDRAQRGFFGMPISLSDFKGYFG